MSNYSQLYRSIGVAPFHFIVVDNKLFLQNFDRIQRISSLFLCKHDFTEIPLSKNSQEIEIIETHFPLANGGTLCRGHFLGCTNYLSLLSPLRYVLLLLLWRGNLGRQTLRRVRRLVPSNHQLHLANIIVVTIHLDRRNAVVFLFISRRGRRSYWRE